MKIKFRKTKMSARIMEQLLTVNTVIEDFQSQGYKMTLRQLYYQLVKANIIPNKDTEYKKLSRILTEGRMAGLVDWDAIEDRLRKPQNVYTVSDVADALSDTYSQYRLDRRRGQKTLVEVWVEKDAISNILKKVTQKYGISLIVNRGYGSATAMKDAYDRYSYRLENGSINNVVILYLGDHDPSGLDMIRDINKRISEMLAYDNLEGFFKIKPIGLTMEQIKLYNPPPNPAKITDTRSPDYIRKFGAVSWEVDALSPKVLHETLETSILKELDAKQYSKIVTLETKQKKEIGTFIDSYEK